MVVITWLSYRLEGCAILYCLRQSAKLYVCISVQTGWKSSTKWSRFPVQCFERKIHVGFDNDYNTGNYCVLVAMSGLIYRITCTCVCTL